MKELNKLLSGCIILIITLALNIVTISGSLADAVEMCLYMDKYHGRIVNLTVFKVDLSKVQTVVPTVYKKQLEKPSPILPYLIDDYDAIKVSDIFNLTERTKKDVLVINTNFFVNAIGQEYGLNIPYGPVYSNGELKTFPDIQGRNSVPFDIKMNPKVPADSIVFYNSQSKSPNFKNAAKIVSSKEIEKFGKKVSFQSAVSGIIVMADGKAQYNKAKLANIQYREARERVLIAMGKNTVNGVTTPVAETIFVAYGGKNPDAISRKGFALQGQSRFFPYDIVKLLHLGIPDNCMDPHTGFNVTDIINLDGGSSAGYMASIDGKTYGQSSFVKPDTTSLEYRGVGAILAIQESGPKSEFEPLIALSDLSDGDEIKFQSTSSNTDTNWLNGTTLSGEVEVGKINPELSSITNAKWQVKKYVDGNFSFQNLGIRDLSIGTWLRAISPQNITGIVDMVPNTDYPGTQWNISMFDDGTYGISNYKESRKVRLWLNGNTETEVVSISPKVEIGFPDTRWKILVKHQ